MLPKGKMSKCCPKCDETKDESMFVKDKSKNICKQCSNKRSREYKNRFRTVIAYVKPEIDDTITKTCNTCNETKSLSLFLKHANKCLNCNNKQRRERYETDNEYRKKLIQKAKDTNHNITVNRQEIRQHLQLEIGVDNKKCKYCDEIKHKDRFRHNRMKCRDCERDDPIEKFKRGIRARVWHALMNKSKHTIEYLGCNYQEYFDWLFRNGDYTLENRGEWHIDHVIPLYHFDMDDENQQLLAFNWRNTMPLSVEDNLKKNTKIVLSQVEQHYDNLLEYHKQNNIEMPQEFIDLFAKHLVAGIPLEPSLPLDDGNVKEELG